VIAVTDISDTGVEAAKVFSQTCSASLRKYSQILRDRDFVLWLSRRTLIFVLWLSRRTLTFVLWLTPMYAGGRILSKVVSKNEALGEIPS